MIRNATLLFVFLAASGLVGATPPGCPADDAIDQARQLLAFHFGDDERIEIDPELEQLTPIANPANPGEHLSVMELWGFVYRGQYRMRLTYYPMDDGCVLVGQEIIEHASFGGQVHGLDPSPPRSGVVRELTLGDRACYIRIEHDGEEVEAMAFMTLCERDELIDRFAIFEHEAGEVMAMSCEGDPECADHETVLLISDVTL